MIYAIANQKGGVGKTTTTVNLGACIAAAGHRVLLVDADAQANATSGVLGGERPGPDALTTADVMLDRVSTARASIPTVVPRLDLVPGGAALAGAAVELVEREGREGLLRVALQAAAAQYPYVFIDCPPSLDLITVNGLVAADRLVVPVQCEYYALEGLSRLIQTVSEVRARLNPELTISGLLMTMHDPRTRISGEVVNEVCTHFPGLVFETIVPRNVRVTESPSFGEPVVRYDPQCAAAEAYQQAAREVMARG
ncbi:MAG: ParA family protein [Actinobacteria bacterium]|nr:ParA family protein [Actinomycetota bacterium]